MQTFTVHALDEYTNKTFEQPLEAADRYHAVRLFHAAWPLATIEKVGDDTFAGYDEITHEPLFTDDDFTADPDGDGGWLYRRNIDTTAEDAR